MARKPIDMEMTGGKSPRQRTWEAIRKARNEFEPAGIAKKAAVTINVVRDYLRCLLAGGVVELVGTVQVNALCVTRTYKLVRDCGVEAPRLTRTGQEVAQGSGNEAMWGTLRRMFKAESVDHRQLAAFAGTKERPISEGTAKAYVLALAAAGYLECVQKSVSGKRAAPARYRLPPKMDTGRRAPMIQRTKSLYDPNLSKIVWTEKAEAIDE